MDGALLIPAVALLLGNGLVVLGGAVRVTRWAGRQKEDLSRELSVIRTDVVGQIGEVKEEMAGLKQAQIGANHRVGKLESSVAYRDTVDALHAQAAQAIGRLEAAREEDREDRREMARKIDSLVTAVRERQDWLSGTLAELRAQRAARGLPPDYEPGGATGG